VVEVVMAWKFAMDVSDLTACEGWGRVRVVVMVLVV
jgi:hypothetical protein